MTEKMKFRRVENIVAKRRKSWLPAFSPFSKAFFLKVKVWFGIKLAIVQKFFFLFWINYTVMSYLILAIADSLNPLLPWYGSNILLVHIQALDTTIKVHPYKCDNLNNFGGTRDTDIQSLSAKLALNSAKFSARF